jgi:mitochondrial fission protein ELM1
VSLNIWILSDGKAGHLSQTRGLATALANRLKGHVFELDLSGKGFRAKWSAVWRACFRLRDADSGQAGTPTFIIAAGHGMHAPLLLAGLLLRKAKTVLCMKPSFPMSWFDFCVVPRHDLTPALLANSPAHIITTLGALHGVHPSPESPKTHTLILIGGPSKEYGWDETQLLEQLMAVIRGVEVRSQPPSPIGLRRPGRAESGENFLLTTSRRTPVGFVDAVRQACPSIEVVPVEETPRGWVAEKLEASTAVWVTRDSVSMIYESLGSGAPVGLLNMPLRSQDGKKKSRVARGIEMLEQEGWVTPFDLWEQSGILKFKGALVEVDRVAELIAGRI